MILIKLKFVPKKIKKGDISILYRGGHAFDALEKNTIIYEIKNGPYLKDKDIKRF